MTDLDLMPFGRFKGKKMQDVPVSYLHWLYHVAADRNQPVIKYIEENLDALKLENPDLIWEP